MSESKPEETPQTTEETPAEPKAEEPKPEETKPEEPKPEEPKAEEPKAEAKPEEPKQEEQPVAAEGDKKTEEAPKSEGATGGEEKKEEKKKEEKKKEQPKPKPVKPPVDRRVVHSGWLSKRGNFFKSYKREYVSLEQDGEVIRVFGEESRSKAASFQLFMANCIKVVQRGDEHAGANWPGNAAMENCFAVHSPNRVLYFIAENEDGAKEWIVKVEEARKKHGKDDLEFVSDKFFSVDSIKKSINRALSSAEQDSQKLANETEDVAKKASEKKEEPKKEEEKKEGEEQQPPAEPAAAAAATPVTTEAEVTQEKPKEEEKPAECKTEEPKAEEAAKPEETKPEEPKEEEPKPEEPKEEEPKPADAEDKNDEGGD